MPEQAIESWQAFSAAHPCPICSCYAPECSGYVSGDLSWVYCTREYRAEDTPPSWSPPSRPVAKCAHAPRAAAPKKKKAPAAEPIRTEGQRPGAAAKVQKAAGPGARPASAGPQAASAVVSSRELLERRSARADGPWLVDGQLPCGGTSLLLGASGCGKSWLVHELAVAVSRGEPWLGLDTRSGPVLFVSLEGSLAELRPRFVDAGLTPADPVHFLDAGGDGLHAAAIRERATQLRPSLIVVDPLQPLLDAEEFHSASRVSSALEQVLALARDTAAHLLLVHRVTRAAVTEVSAMLNSTSRPLDAIYTLERSGDARLLRALPRGGETPEPIALPLRTRARRARSDDATRDLPLQHAVLAYLRKATHWVTQAEILDGVCGDGERVLDALRELRARGRVLRSGLGTVSDPYRYSGCDWVARGKNPWLRTVRPWARPTGLLE